MFQSWNLKMVVEAKNGTEILPMPESRTNALNVHMEWLNQYISNFKKLGNILIPNNACSGGDQWERKFQTLISTKSSAKPNVTRYLREGVALNANGFTTSKGIESSALA